MTSPEGTASVEIATSAALRVELRKVVDELERLVADVRDEAARRRTTRTEGLPDA